LASRTEIIDAIQAGINRVCSTFASLSEDQLETTIYEGPNGWKAREILAHLAGRQETYDMLIAMAFESNGTPPAGFNIDTWNQRLVDDRSGSDRDSLLEEFKTVHENLIARVETFRDDQLALPIALPNRETTLGDVLLGSGGMHSMQHAADTEQALDLPN
jgi:hypothetical protein